MGDVSNPGSIRRGRALRQVEIAAQDRLLVLWAERGVVLADVGLDQAQFHAGQAWRSRAPSAGTRRRRRCSASASAATTVGARLKPAFAHPPQRRRGGEDRDRQEGEPVQADERGGLGEREIDAERHAKVVPGKAGEQEAARPFRHPEPKGERENAQRPRRPQETRERKASGRKDSRAPPAAPRPQAAAPRRICRPRPKGPSRPTRGRRENSRSPSTSRPRMRR